MDSERRSLLTKLSTVSLGLSTSYFSLSEKAIGNDALTIDPESKMAKGFGYRLDSGIPSHKCENCVLYTKTDSRSGRCGVLNDQVLATASCNAFIPKKGIRTIAKNELEEERRLERVARVAAEGIPRVNRNVLNSAVSKYLQIVSGASDRFYGNLLDTPREFLYSCDGLNCTAMGGVIEYEWSVRTIDNCDYRSDSKASCIFRMSMISQSTIQGAVTNIGNEYLRRVGDLANVAQFMVDLNFNEEQAWWELASPVRLK